MERWEITPELVAGLVADQFLSGLSCRRNRSASPDGPQAGYGTCYFGVPLAHWDAQTRTAISDLGRDIDGRLAAQLWQTALDSAPEGPDSWFHGTSAQAISWSPTAS